MLLIVFYRFVKVARTTTHIPKTGLSPQKSEMFHFEYAER